MIEAQMTAHARRIEREFEHEMSRPRPLMRETFYALSIIDEIDHWPECSGDLRSGMLANDADKGFRTVLVVEDDELLRATVSDVLRGSGFDVREAAMVGEARQLLAGTPAIDILFGDVLSPAETLQFRHLVGAA